MIYTISGADQRARCGRRSSICSAYAGKDIFVRLVDEETGASTATYIKENPWAHINFDRFRFHDSKPFFPNEITPSDITADAADGSGHARRACRPPRRRGR